jgi:hypothetical protein
MERKILHKVTNVPPRQKLDPENRKIAEKTTPSLGKTSRRPWKTPENKRSMFWKKSRKSDNRREITHF